MVGDDGPVAPSARLPWAVSQVDLSPDAHVLEVGCGHGIAAEAVLAALGPDGRYVGLDRSPRMSAAARRRVAAIGRERATFVVGEVPDLEPPGAPFDVVFAARVAAMARPAALAWARRHLTPDGRLALVVDAPDERRARAQLAGLLTAVPTAGFATPDVVTTRVDGALVACVTAVRV